MHLRTVLRSTPSSRANVDRQSLSMKIKNHDDFPKLDHQTAPSFRAKRDWVIDSPPIPRARPGMGDTINWGIFKRHFWGALLRHQHTSSISVAAAAPTQSASVDTSRSTPSRA